MIELVKKNDAVISAEEQEYGNFLRCQERFAAGEVIVYGRSDLLLIDLDSEEETREFSRRMVIFEEIYGELQKFKTRSPSERGWHIYIKIPGSIPPQTIPQRIAMQALLGSDIKRDLLSLKFQIDQHGDVNDKEDFYTNPIFLFEKDPTGYPEWVISKESIQKQRVQQVVILAKKYGVKVDITGTID